MKKTISIYPTKRAGKIPNLLICHPAEEIIQAKDPSQELPKSHLTTPPLQANYPAPHPAEKGNKRHKYRITIVLLVNFAILGIFSLFGHSVPAFAANYHMAAIKSQTFQLSHKQATTAQQDPTGGTAEGKPWYCYVIPAFLGLESATVMGFTLQGANVLFSTPEVAGTGGTVYMPGVARTALNTALVAGALGAGVGGGVAMENKDIPECSGKRADQLIFDCSDNANGNPNVSAIKQDWLSGDPTQINETGPRYGHIARTYAADTYSQANVQTLLSYSQMIGFILITPSIILIGYQLLLAATAIIRYASAMEAISRVLWGSLAILASYQIVQMLIGLENTAADALVALHNTLQYPTITINSIHATFGLPGDEVTSYRGIVMPMNRWGCAANDFIAILGVKLLIDIATMVPFVGGFLGIAGKITSISLLLHSIGEFTLLILSISFWAQTLLRIVLINYYIVIAPLAFGCWGLPGGIGQAVVKKWAKGFLSVLVLQIVQLFILTVVPLILPSNLSGMPLDKLGIFQALLMDFPRIFVLLAALKGPKILTGESPLTSIAQASMVAGSTIGAAGAAMWNIV